MLFESQNLPCLSDSRRSPGWRKPRLTEANTDWLTATVCMVISLGNLWTAVWIGIKGWCKTYFPSYFIYTGTIPDKLIENLSTVGRHPYTAQERTQNTPISTYKTLQWKSYNERLKGLRKTGKKRLKRSAKERDPRARFEPPAALSAADLLRLETPQQRHVDILNAIFPLSLALSPNVSLISLSWKYEDFFHSK